MAFFSSLALSVRHHDRRVRHSRHTRAGNISSRFCAVRRADLEHDANLIEPRRARLPGRECKHGDPRADTPLTGVEQRRWRVGVAPHVDDQQQLQPASRNLRLQPKTAFSRRPLMGRSGRPAMGRFRPFLAIASHSRWGASRQNLIESLSSRRRSSFSCAWRFWSSAASARSSSAFLIS